mgnify:CR=1 FL=1
MASPKNSWVLKGFFSTLFVLICLLAFLLTACQKNDQQGIASKEETAPTASVPQTATPAEGAEKALGPGDPVIEVDGVKMTKGQLDTEVNRKLESIRKRVPAEKLPQVKTNIQKRLIDDFVVKTLLNNEVNRLKITATEQEVNEAVEKLKSSLPANVSLENLLKKNQMTREKMREEIRLGIQINKLMVSRTKNLPKPTEKEITSFYKKNQDRFKLPEAVHVRHILIARAPDDGEKVIAEKKAKAEGLRKKILAGADFAELAKSNSDCPSKSAGGDLGIVSRGQMVKPFEDAIFSLKKNQIGPVVQTEYGFHVVQVLDVRQPKTVALDERTKGMISSFLLQQKQQEAFRKMVASLKEKANIIAYMP